MTMHKALHPRDSIDRLYVIRKDGERGLERLEDCVDALTQRLEDYVKTSIHYRDIDIGKNNKETELGRKTTLRIFQATN